MASTWKSNEHAKGYFWGAHAGSVLAIGVLAIANFPVGSASVVPRCAIHCKKDVCEAKRRNQHARRVRSPDSAIAAAVDVPIMTTRWTRKDLLGLRELTADEINFVLETTDAFKQVGTREIKKVPALRGKTLVNFFVEPSTRTRTSFELAAFRLSADVINISATTSSLTKGETLKDTARNLEALQADIIVLRHSSAGAPQFLASRLKASVINAGDGAHEHPTQALLDLYTIRERRGKIAGLHVAIIGDILFSRVARSNIFGLLKLGARVTLVGPSTLVPREFEKLGVEVSHKIEDVLLNCGCRESFTDSARAAAQRIFSWPRRIHPLVWPNERTRETFEAGLPDHASRTDQPRGRDRQRSRRRIAKRDSRPGHQRPRRAHGGSVFVRRDRDVRALASCYVWGAHSF